MNQEEYDEILGVNSVCIGKNYLPTPTRLWYRASNVCNQIPDATVFIPYLNREVSREEVRTVFEVFQKGNVLQYPANRYTTKVLAYTKIVKGCKRKKGWSSQTDTFTDPNVNKLQRNNSNIVSNNSNGEYFFPECAVPFKNTRPFPTYLLVKTSGDTANIGDVTIPKESNPVKYPTIFNNAPNNSMTGSIAYPISTPIIPENELVPSRAEGGTLISCTNENTCSGIISQQLKNITCIPTSDSNVPGPVINICYPANIPITVSRRKTYASNNSVWSTNIPAYNTNLPINQKIVKRLSSLQFNFA